MTDGALYTVMFFRDNEEDDPTQHGSRSPIDQFSAEMQEAMDETGQPAGFFKVTERREATWSEWDDIRHIGSEAPGAKPERYVTEMVYASNDTERFSGDVCLWVVLDTTVAPEEGNGIVGSFSDPDIARREAVFLNTITSAVKVPRVRA